MSWTCVSRAGTVILKAGDYLDGLYYIVAGEVDVQVPPPFAPSAPAKVMSVSGVTRAASLGETQRLGKDDTFGEGGALTRYPVGINVTAVNDVRCLFIKSQALLAMFDSEKVAPFQARFDQRYRTRVLRSHLPARGSVRERRPGRDGRAAAPVRPGQLQAEQADRHRRPAVRVFLFRARRAPEAERPDRDGRSRGDVLARPANGSARPRCCWTRRGRSA